MRQALEKPFYYRENFRQVLALVSRHHSDLLDETELAFIERFALLPQPSQALLVRMVMRKGMLFRASKLRYLEIGCSRRAVEPLIDQGWSDASSDLTLEQLRSEEHTSELQSLMRNSYAALSLNKKNK